MFILRSKRKYIISYVIEHNMLGGFGDAYLHYLLNGLSSVENKNGSFLIGNVVFAKDTLKHIKKRRIV